MILTQSEIKTVLNWVLEIENRIFSAYEITLIENLIKNHAETKKCIQVYEMKKEIEKLIENQIQHDK